MRVLILNWKDLLHPAAGGAEVFTEEVARALVGRGHSVTLFVAAVDGRPAREVIEGVEIVRRGGRLGVYVAARRYWSHEARGSYDVVVDEINTRPFMAPRWIDDTPVVALIHQVAREIWSYETQFPLSVLGRYVLEPWWLRAYRRVPALTVSKSSAESLVQFHGWKDITVVPEGSDSHPVPTVSKEPEPTIAFLGRLVPMKRPQHAIDAFLQLRRTYPSARLWVIGDGPLLEDLREAAPPGVEFLGRLERHELYDRLGRAHLLVATSVREGWGLNVSEAAACGTPSLAYRVPGLADSVLASGGLLVEPKVEALSDGLVEFFSGTLTANARPSTVPWSEVADAIERRLKSVVEAAR